MLKTRIVEHLPRRGVEKESSRLGYGGSSRRVVLFLCWWSLGFLGIKVGKLGLFPLKLPLGGDFGNCKVVGPDSVWDDRENI